MKSKIKVKAKVNYRVRYYIIETRAKTVDGIRKAKYRHLHQLGYQYVNKKIGWVKQAVKRVIEVKPEAKPKAVNEGKLVAINGVITRQDNHHLFDYISYEFYVCKKYNDDEIIALINKVIEAHKLKLIWLQGVDRISISGVRLTNQKVLCSYNDIENEVIKIINGLHLNKEKRAKYRGYERQSFQKAYYEK
jgi:hypothetical protein